jgi:pimeloyl-ACP methyl ester carboxylesterase
MAHVTRHCRERGLRPAAYAYGTIAETRETEAIQLQPGGLPSGRNRLRRVARVVGIGALATFLVLTVTSLAYNVATNGRMKPASALYPGPFLRVEGTRLAYRRWGERGSPVVLLGGFAEPSWVWHSVGARLGRSHRVFALDLPPFGFSERRGPYTLARWSDLALGFARRLGLSRPVFVGHSLGAAVAVRAALADPSGVGGIVLVDGDALPGGGPGWLAHLLLPPWYTSAFRIATGADWLVRSVLHNAWPHSPPLTPALLAEFERPFRVQGTEGAFRSLLGYGIQGVSPADLGRVRGRRLVIWGNEDSIDSVAAGRRTAALLDARFVLVPAGHLSILGAPARVASAIDAFAR